MSSQLRLAEQLDTDATDCYAHVRYGMSIQDLREANVKGESESDLMANIKTTFWTLGLLGILTGFALRSRRLQRVAWFGT